jgi:hypothetical protein
VDLRVGLHGSAYLFGLGLLNIYQVLLLKPDSGRSGLHADPKGLVSLEDYFIKQNTPPNH